MLLRGQGLLAHIGPGCGRLLGRASDGGRAHGQAAGLGVVASGSALHLRWSLNSTLVKARVEGGHIGLVLGPAFQGSGSVEGYGLGLRGGGKGQGSGYK